MKRLALILLVALGCIPSFAQLNGTGYYRVSNEASGRYVYVCGNTGSVNYSTSDAYMSYIHLWKNND